MRALIFGLVALFGSGLFGQSDSLRPKLLSPSDVDQLPYTAGDTIRYGKEAQQYGILRSPKVTGTERLPIVIIIHGGCWYSPYAQARNTAAIATAINEQINVFTWNIEYRQFDNGGGFPNTFLDVAQAVDYVEELAKRYPINLDQIAVYGHSAGGHLALWSAARENIPESSLIYTQNPLSIQHVIGVGAIADLSAFDVIEEETCGIVCVSKLMGGSKSEVPDHYAAGDPVELFPIPARVNLITGEYDKIVPKSHGNAFVELSKADDRNMIEHLYIQNAGHHEYNDPNSVVWPIIKFMIQKKFKI